MYCPNCGSNMNDGIRFCTQCGTKLNVDQPNVAADAPKKIESTPGKMTKIQCELCGSTDIMKEEGFFVCQHCGCKYSLEEARKMMIEGKVDVSGSTVKVDTSNELKGRFMLALDEYNDNRLRSADNAIEEIIKIDPMISDVWYLRSIIYRHSDEGKSQSYRERAKDPSTHTLGIIDENRYQEMYGYTLTINTKKAMVSNINEYFLWLDGLLVGGCRRIGTPSHCYVTKGPHRIHISGNEDGSGGAYHNIEMNGDMSISAKPSGMGYWKIE